MQNIRLISLGFALLASARILAAEPTSNIDKLVEQLGSKSFPERERASKALRDRGPVVLPALRKALASTDAELRKRAEELIPPLEIEEALRPKRVTLKSDGRRGSTLIDEIAFQTKYEVKSNGKDNGRTATLDLKNVTFWEALERVARETGLVVELDSYAGEGRLRMIPGRSPFTMTQGLFHLEATRFEGERVIDFRRVTLDKPSGERKKQLRLTISIHGEPRLNLLRCEAAKLEVADDEDGKSLIGAESMAESNSRHGNFNQKFRQASDVNLSRASETAKTIKLLRGTIPIKVVLIQKDVVVTNKVLESKGTRFRAGTDELEIVEVSTRRSNGTIDLRIAIPPGARERWRWNGRFHVEDDAGNRFSLTGNDISSDRADRQFWLEVWHHAPFDKKVGPPTKLVFEDWVIHDMKIPFEFKDIPLP